MGRDPLKEALEAAYQLGERNMERMSVGRKSLDVDEELKKIKERYFL